MFSSLTYGKDTMWCVVWRYTISQQWSGAITIAEKYSTVIRIQRLALTSASVRRDIRFQNVNNFNHHSELFRYSLRVALNSPRNPISVSLTAEASLTATQPGINESSNPIRLAGRRPVGAGRDSTRGGGRLLCALPRTGDAEGGSNVTCMYAGASASPLRPEPARAGIDSNARGEEAMARASAGVGVRGGRVAAETGAGGVNGATGEDGADDANTNTSSMAEWLSSVLSGASRSGRHSPASASSA